MAIDLSSLQRGKQLNEGTVAAVHGFALGTVSTDLALAEDYNRCSN
jgi:hypothetical protein